MLREDLQNALKDSMKNRDMDTVGAVRLIIAKMKEKDVEIRGKGGKEAVDSDICSLMQGMIKQRRDSIKMFEDGGRVDLAKKEQSEIDVIERFLPKQMNETEIKTAIEAIISETSAQGIKDMGKVMGVLKEKYTGKLDMGKASGIIKSLLS